MKKGCEYETLIYYISLNIYFNENSYKFVYVGQLYMITPEVKK